MFQDKELSEQCQLLPRVGALSKQSDVPRTSAMQPECGNSLKVVLQHENARTTDTKNLGSLVIVEDELSVSLSIGGKKMQGIDMHIFSHEQAFFVVIYI